ncbi:hypothetical protein R50072_23110 [Simiduia litorea]|uniref:hypothetical protein n=1 Tax=Simiduia litorea TaxID=1435348 RepID=UPI0036F43788
MQKNIYRWLIGLGLLHAMGGVLLVFILDTPLAEPYLDYLAQQLAVQDGHHAGTPVLLALFGPTVASWGILFCLAVDYYYTSGKAMVKWLSFAAIFVWLLLDSTISGFYGLYWHWYINGFMATALCLPLLLLQPKQHH